MKPGLVSILMPVYNGSAFLDRSIGSVLKQSYANWEIIIVDDHSSDNSSEVVKKYLNDKRIILKQNDCNKGIAASRNLALKQAKGDFIAILDQDDEWLPQKLEKQMRLFNSLDSTFGLVYCNTKVQFENGHVQPFKKDIAPRQSIEENFKKLYLTNYISSLTVVFRKECIQKVGYFNENIQWGGDDYDLWLRISAQYKFAFVDEVLCIRHEHGKNFSHAKKKMMYGSLETGNELIENKPERKTLLNQRTALLYYRYGIETLKTGPLTEGLNFVIKALFTSPIAFQELGKTILNRFGK